MANFVDDLPWTDDADEREPDRPGVSLSLEQQQALAAAVGERMRSCDGTLDAARDWARRAGVNWTALRRELEDNGGFCDCEVVFNIFGGDCSAAPDSGGSAPG